MAVSPTTTTVIIITCWGTTTLVWIVAAVYFARRAGNALWGNKSVQGETGATDHQFNLTFRLNNYTGWNSWKDDSGQWCGGNTCIPGHHYT